MKIDHNHRHYFCIKRQLQHNLFEYFCICGLNEAAYINRNGGAL